MIDQILGILSQVFAYSILLLTTTFLLENVLPEKSFYIIARIFIFGVLVSSIGFAIIGIFYT